MRNFNRWEKEGFQARIIDQIPNLLDDAIDWIRSKLTPDDIFEDKELEAWAETHGYIKGE